MFGSVGIPCDRPILPQQRPMLRTSVGWSDGASGETCWVSPDGDVGEILKAVGEARP